MPYVLACILSILLYIGGGWCFYNIYTSIVPLKGTETLHDIACDQLLVYGIWATVVIVFSLTKAEKEGEHTGDFATFCMFAPLCLWGAAKYMLPMSLGFGIINVVLVVVVMTYSLGLWFNRL